MSTQDTVTQQSTRHGSRVSYPLHTRTFPTQKPGIFSEITIKKQTILLVSKLLKQFCYLTIRARQGRFWAIYVPFPVVPAADVDCLCSRPMEIKYSGLDFLCGSTTTLWHMDVKRLN